MTTLTLNGKPLAENYRPDNPPPRWITWDWLQLSGSVLTAAELDTQLRTGARVELSPGNVLEWSVAG